MSIRQIFIFMILFLLLLIFQFFVLNNLNIDHRIIIKIYFVPLLFLPMNLNRTQLYLVCFLLGLGIDFFELNFGVNSFSILILLAFKRAFYRQFFDEGERKEIFYLTDKTLNLLNFILYLASATVVFHTCYFLFESYYALSFTDLLLSIVLSSTTALLLNILISLFFLDNLNSNDK